MLWFSVNVGIVVLFICCLLAGLMLAFALVVNSVDLIGFFFYFDLLLILLSYCFGNCWFIGLFAYLSLSCLRSVIGLAVCLVCLGCLGCLLFVCLLMPYFCVLG